VFGRAPPEEPEPFWRSLCFSLKNDSYKTFGRAPLEEPEPEPGRSPAKQALRRPLQGAQKRH